MGIKSNNSAAYYYNVFGVTGSDAVPLPPPVPVTATGGVKTTPGDGYVYHRFTPGLPGAYPLSLIHI